MVHEWMYHTQRKWGRGPISEQNRTPLQHSPLILPMPLYRSRSACIDALLVQRRLPFQYSIDRGHVCQFCFQQLVWETTEINCKKNSGIHSNDARQPGSQ